MRRLFITGLLPVLTALSIGGCTPHPDAVPFINACKSPIRVTVDHADPAKSKTVTLNPGDLLNVRYTAVRVRVTIAGGKTLFDESRDSAVRKFYGMIPRMDRRYSFDARFAISEERISVMTNREWDRFRREHHGRIYREP